MKQLYILVACLALTLPTRLCQAQEASGNVKGIVGGGMMGAEVVMLTEAALGVKNGWFYLAGGVAGAGGGVAAGIFIEKSSNPRPPIYLFAGSLALVIPTMIAVLSATHFEPPATYRQDLPADEENPEGPAPLEGASYDLPRPPLASAADAAAPGWALSLPVLDVRPAFSDEELAIHGLKQHAEFHLSVLNGVF
jgi:MFS family permease